MNTEVEKVPDLLFLSAEVHLLDANAHHACNRFVFTGIDFGHQYYVIFKLFC